jgi:D-alanyl-lipoteichoic acid acyltransferase DltB (MBOAT superfamily)
MDRLFLRAGGATMSRKILQSVAVVYCAAVLVAALWFWSRQVNSVIELLRIAYG